MRNLSCCSKLFKLSVTSFSAHKVLISHRNKFVPCVNESTTNATFLDLWANSLVPIHTTTLWFMLMVFHEKIQNSGERDSLQEISWNFRIVIIYLFTFCLEVKSVETGRHCVSTAFQVFEYVTCRKPMVVEVFNIS